MTLWMGNISTTALSSDRLPAQRGERQRGESDYRYQIPECRGDAALKNQVAEYVEGTGNHVLYRVTPVFAGTNLLADGVLMEAFSVEGRRRGRVLCVFCYNVQPGIVIDYAQARVRWLKGVLFSATPPT